ncbi:MAG TPA: hypothetical protein VM911_11620 [Pyrinomonadaceae bacterium]|jgi:hypothetical protein|nr:hypothetical protein [Pyrinomonadaceae bacterium]
MNKQRAVFLFLLISLTVTAFVLSVQAQNGAPTLPQQHARILNKKFIPKEPVEIVGVKTEGHAVNFGGAFAAREDWLKGLTLNLKNISDKPIVYIAIDVRVDGTVMPRRRSAVTMAYGQRPPGPAGTPGSPAQRSIAPGESVEIVLTDALYDDLRTLVQQDASDISRALDKAELKIDFIIFGDDSAWGNGRKLRRDPNNPNKWDALSNIAQQ